MRKRKISFITVFTTEYGVITLKINTQIRGVENVCTNVRTFCKNENHIYLRNDVIFIGKGLECNGNL